MLKEVVLNSLSPVRRVKRPMWLLTALVGFLVFAGVQAFAQLTTADIIGTVRDSSGALVANAKVALQHIEKNQSTAAVTDSAGNFAFTFLVPGHYSVRVEAPGFKVVTIPNLAVWRGQGAR